MFLKSSELIIFKSNSEKQAPTKKPLEELICRNLNTSLMLPNPIIIGFDITQKERGRILSNFQTAKKILEAEHFVCEEFHEFPITLTSIQKYRILIFACPDSSKFKPEEITVLQSYVAAGGNLLLFNHAGGDQGRRTNLGEITNPFGLNFINDEVLDSLSNLGVESYPLLTTFYQHPILANIENICYRIGCSLEITAEIIPLVLTSASAEPPQKAVLGLIRHGKGHILASGSYEMFQDEVKGGISYLNNATLLTNIVHWLASGTPTDSPNTTSTKNSPPPLDQEISPALHNEIIINPSQIKEFKVSETQNNKIPMEVQKLRTEFQRLYTENAELKEKFRIIELNLSNFPIQSFSDLIPEFKDLKTKFKTHSDSLRVIEKTISTFNARLSKIEADLEQKLENSTLDESSLEESSPPPPIITAAALFAQRSPSQNMKQAAEINAYKQMIKMLDDYFKNGTLPEDIYQQKRLKFEKKLEELQQPS